MNGDYLVIWYVSDTTKEFPDDILDYTVSTSEEETSERFFEKTQREHPLGTNGVSEERFVLRSTLLRGW